MPVEIDCLESLDALRSIEDEWRAVWLRDPSATPFQSPDWLLPWTRWLWGGGRLRVLTVRDRGEMIAVAPFFLWGYGARPEVIRVSFLGAGITDHLGMVAAPEREAEAARAVLDALAALPGEWHACDLQELRPGSPLLRAEPPEGVAAQDAPSGVCPVLALPKTYDELLASVDAKFRRNLRVAENRLAAGGAEYGCVSPDAREGLVRMHVLRVAGGIIAVQYNLRRDRRVYTYLSGFDPAYQRSSPGCALLARSIRAAIDEGATHFDFLRNREEFKYQWGARDRINRRLILSHTAASAREVA